MVCAVSCSTLQVELLGATSRVILSKGCSAAHQDSQVDLLSLILPDNPALLGKGSTDRDLLCSDGTRCISNFIPSHILLALLETVRHIANGSTLRYELVDALA